MSRLRTTSYSGDPRVKPPYGSVEIDRRSVGLFDYLLLNETAGQTMTNLASPHVSATGTSAPTWVLNAAGSGLNVTAGSYFSIPDHGNIAAGDLSVRVVFIPTSYTGTYSTLFAKLSGANRREVSAFINTSGQVQYVEIGQVALDALARGSMPVGVLSDFVLTRRGDTCQIYVNGIAAGATFTLGGTTAGSGNRTRFGSDETAGGTNFDGTYIHSDIRVGYAFSPSEVLSLYNRRYDVVRPIIRRRYFFFTSAEAAEAVAGRRRYVTAAQSSFYPRSNRYK